MMRGRAWTIIALAPWLASCGTEGLDQPIETSFALTNLHRTRYVALRIRTHDATDASAYFSTALLPPGATARHRFLDTVNDACPDALDLQILLYDRVNGDLPIGLDPDETVTDAPVVAGALRNVPACSVQPLETFTVVNWDTDDDTGRVKLAQATPIEQVLRATDFLGNPDAVWEILNTDSTLAAEAPPAAAPGQPIRGRVVAPDGAPWEGVGVLVRTRWRSNLDLANPAADSGFGDPIDFTFTDADGNFSFTRPAGAYRVEVFADDLIFSPASADVEVPQTALVFIAEAIP
jgi:hypothetical protein